MPITNHVTSLDLSRRLKELGVKAEGYFSWVEWGEEKSIRVFHGSIRTGEPIERIAPAYLASELGEMIYKNHKLMVCPNWEDRGVYRMQYDLQWWCEGKTLADVYAKMLIYLIENHLISVEELGK